MEVEDHLGRRRYSSVRTDGRFSREVYVWGRGGDGLLGNGSYEDVPVPTKVSALSNKEIYQVSCGAKHTLGLSKTGEVYAWGWNWNGQLGIDGPDRDTPTLVKSLALIKALNGIKFIAVSAGSDHTIALSRDGSVYTWGGNPDGQLGNGDESSAVQLFPSKVLSLHLVKVVDISSRGGHNLCLSDNGRVFSWGRANNGRCGHGPKSVDNPILLPKEITSIKCIAIACGWSHSLALVLPTGQPWESADAVPRVYAWGKASDGMLGIGGSTEQQPEDQFTPVEVKWFAENNIQITQISGGYYHSAAIDKNGRLYTWGWGEHGQLGHGSFKNEYTPRMVEFPQSCHIVRVDCGGFHTIALTNQGQLYAFGLAEYGQLGNSSPPMQRKVSIPLKIPERKGNREIIKNGKPKSSHSLPPNEMKILRSKTPKRHFSTFEPRTFSAFDLEESNQRLSLEFSEGDKPQNVATPVLLQNFNENVESISCGWWYSVAITHPIKRKTSREEFRSTGNVEFSPPISPDSNRNLFNIRDDDFDKEFKEIKKQVESSNESFSMFKNEVNQLKDSNLVDLEESTSQEIVLTEPNGETDESIIEKCATYLANVFFHQTLHQKTVLINRRTAQSLQEERNRKLKFMEQSKEDKDVQVWRKILPNWNKLKHNPSTIQLLSSGIPASVRGAVWRKAIGNSLKINEKIYEECKIKARMLRNMETEDKQSQFRLIEVDVPRTFNSTDLFKIGGAYYEPLMTVLECYATYKPEIGYVQGMSYLAAHLLLYNDTYYTFMCFANLVESNFFQALFKMEIKLILRHMRVFDLLFSHNLPKLFERFQEMTISPEQYLLNWFITIFTTSLPIPTASKIWDHYIYYGEIYLYRTALGILLAHKKQLMEADFEECVSSLRKLPETMNEDELFQSIAQISVHPSVIDLIEKLKNGPDSSQLISDA